MAQTIALITAHDSPNYGSCLQTYATQTLLEKLGFDVVVVDYRRKHTIPRYSVKRILTEGQFVKHTPVFKIPGVKALAYLPVYFLVKMRALPLERFRHQYLKLSKRMYFSEDDLEKDCPNADIYITGSDQVWNSTWNNGFEAPYYLRFAPKGACKIAYASSIGKAHFEEWEKGYAYEALSQYQSISVRESSAIDALSEIGITGATSVLDPTLMLEGKEWEALASNEEVNEPYALVYQLNKNKKMSAYIDALLARHHLNGYQITYGVHEQTGRAKAVCCPSVQQFLGYFRKATYVITDSFHGVVFSVLFQKRFAVILPERFPNRLVDFLTMLNLEHRIVDDYQDSKTLFEEIEYSSVEKALRDERQQSLAFLKKALHVQLDGQS